MKTFRDLQFEKHYPYYSDAKQAKMSFENGYAISVVLGEQFYSNGINTYEIAILDNTGHICYNTPITDDVIGHQTAEEVTKIMREIQELPSLN